MKHSKLAPILRQTNTLLISLFPTVIGETTPSTYYHFTINDPQGLFTQLQLADTFIPAPVALHEESCVDPETLLALPATVKQSLQDVRLQTRVSCATNNVCDASYYDGGTLLQPLLLIDFEGASIDTLSKPWNAFIDTDSATASVRRNPARQSINPWYNVPPFADLDQGFTPASR